MHPASQHEASGHAPPSALNLFVNPILRRYRRSQMRPVRLSVTITLTLVIAGFIATMAYLPLKYRVGFSTEDAARAAFIPLLIYQSFILMFSGTAAIGMGILRETEEGMVEYQRLTPLSPLAKVLGYLFGLPIRQYVAFGITAVLSGCSIVLGKIPFSAWGAVYLILFTTVVLYHLLALITGLITQSRWRAGLISLGLVLLLNLVLPRLADFGFAMFSHLTIIPVVMENFRDLIPSSAAVKGWPQQIGGSEVPFWGWGMSHLAFGLMVQGSLIVTFITMLVRRWRDDQAHLLGKGYTLISLFWLQTILLGNVLPLLDRGRVIPGMTGGRGDLAVTLAAVSGSIEARILAVIYGVISLVLLLPLISCMTPREHTQMAALRRRRKLGQRRVPFLDDGATAAPFVWIGAIATGAAWATFSERLFTSAAFGTKGFPVEGWAVFIGAVLVFAAIFHFLLEAYGRRAAWMAVFLAGFVPLFSSLILISVSNAQGETARYLTGLSLLSTPWQPMQWLDQWGLLQSPDGKKGADFGPFLVFCGVHVFLCVVLFVVWRRRRLARVAKA